MVDCLQTSGCARLLWLARAAEALWSPNRAYTISPQPHQPSTTIPSKQSAIIPLLQLQQVLFHRLDVLRQLKERLEDLILCRLIRQAGDEGMDRRNPG